MVFNYMKKWKFVLKGNTFLLLLKENIFEEQINFIIWLETTKTCLQYRIKLFS